MDCPSCGSHNERGALACGSCGRRLHGTVPATVRIGPLVPAAAARPAAPAAFAAGRYQTKRLLGEGGNKRVYLAHDRDLDRDVAIAVLKVRDDEARNRIRREAQAMAQLDDHPHIVTIYDIGEEDGQLYLVTQFMAGGDLETMLARAEDGRLPLDDALRIADQVCQALEYVHARSIVHRDLKPSNVWLTAGGTAKLGDFGLALFTDRPRLTQDDTIAGTFLYMAPEQAQDRPLDGRADLYALGVMLYQMVTGRLPFMGTTVASLIDQHARVAPEAPSRHQPGLPRALDALILRLLAKQPDARPANAPAVREELAALRAMGSAQPPHGVPSESGRATGSEPARVSTLLDRMAGGAFVGRAAEMATLRAMLDETLAGDRADHAPVVAMLAGEAGVGKTRLAEEFAAQARAGGARVVWGRCYEDAGAPAFWPWIQVLRACTQGLDAPALAALLGSGAAVIAQLVSEVRDRLPHLAPLSASLEAEEARFRLFDGITALVRGIVERGPLVLVLEDLHWADRSSLLLLQYLARELRGARLLIVGTYRDVETDRGHPLSQALAGLTRERLGQRIHVQGLAPAEVRALLESLMRQTMEEGGAALAASLHRETEGNPFFIEEILRHMVEAGALYRRDGRWESSAASVADLGLPEGVRDVIRRRLSRLSDVSNHTLTTAAILGREFDLDIMQRVAAALTPPLSDDQVLDALDEAAAAQVIAEDRRTPGRYRFTHALIRQTLYEELSAGRRLRLHARIGEVLAALWGARSGPHLAEIAHHFLQAGRYGEPDKAVAYARQAGDYALRILAYDEAVRLYDAALDALSWEGADSGERGAEDDPLRCELLLVLGDAQHRAGDGAGAKRSFEAAVALARSLRVPPSTSRPSHSAEAGMFLARAALGLSDESPTGIVDHALIALLEEALAALSAADSALRARLLAQLAISRHWAEGPERSADISRQAVEVARRVADPTALVFALTSWHWVLSQRATPEQRVAAASEIIDLAHEAGDKRAALEGFRLRIADLLELGDIAAVDRDLATYAEYAESLRRPQFLWYATVLHGMRAQFGGAFAEADRLLDQSLQIGARTQHQNVMGVYAVQLFVLRREQGRLKELEGFFIGAMAQYAAMPILRAAVVDLHLNLGREEDARREFERLAARDFADLPMDINWLPGIMVLSEACAALDDARAAVALEGLLRPYAGRCVVLGYTLVCLGSASRALGLLAATIARAARDGRLPTHATSDERPAGGDPLPDWGAAERYFEDATAMHSATGARSWLARTRYDHAAMLAARAAPGDGERAATLVGEALAAACELGMARLADQARALQTTLMGMPPV